MLTKGSLSSVPLMGWFKLLHHAQVISAPAHPHVLYDHHANGWGEGGRIELYGTHFPWPPRLWFISTEPAVTQAGSSAPRIVVTGVLWFLR